MLKAQASNGDSISILSLIKTQGSDTKLVGQMQPYYEALGLYKQNVGQQNIPTLVSQIADGENGGVMMNEFPDAYIQAYKKIGPKNDINPTIAMNGSEYLDLLETLNISQDNYPVIQAMDQNKIWGKILGPITPSAIEKAIAELKEEDRSFTMNGASWTNNLSWEEGYKNVLESISKLSSSFHQTFDHLVIKDPSTTKTHNYQESLLYLLLLETSCFRYWGHGKWTEYAQTLFERGEKILKSLEELKSN